MAPASRPSGARISIIVSPAALRWVVLEVKNVRMAPLVVDAAIHTFNVPSDSLAKYRFPPPAAAEVRKGTACVVWYSQNSNSYVGYLHSSTCCLPLSRTCSSLLEVGDVGKPARNEQTIVAKRRDCSRQQSKEGQWPCRYACSRRASTCSPPCPLIQTLSSMLDLGSWLWST